MWFTFPKGTEELSVERQNFVAEVVDDETGLSYFRAPDHFAHLILGLDGFIVKDPPEEIVPENLPPLIGQQANGAIETLAREKTVLEAEVGSIRADLNAANAKIGALVRERDGLTATVEKLEAQNIQLREQLEDAVIAQPEKAKK